MIFRKEQRPIIMKETNIRDSASVNAIVGKKVSVWASFWIYIPNCPKYNYVYKMSFDHMCSSWIRSGVGIMHFYRLIIFICSLPVAASLLNKPLHRLIHNMSDKDTSMLTLRGSFSTVEESDQRGADKLLCGSRKGKNPPCATSPGLVLQTQLCTCAVYM